MRSTDSWLTGAEWFTTFRAMTFVAITCRDLPNATSTGCRFMAC